MNNGGKPHNTKGKIIKLSLDEHWPCKQMKFRIEKHAHVDQLMKEMQRKKRQVMLVARVCSFSLLCSNFTIRKYKLS